MSPGRAIHRSGPMKQKNKPHKPGRKGKRHDKSKMDVKKITCRKKTQLTRMERKNQMIQRRKMKREEILKKKGRLGGLKSAPLLAMILPLDDVHSATTFLEKIKSCRDDLDISENDPDKSISFCHILCRRFKQRYTFLTPNKSDLHSIMDALKVCEILILLHSDNPVDKCADTLLSIIMAHALPTPIHVIQGLDKLNPKKKAEYRKHVSKSMESRFPDIKLHQADSKQDLQNLLRQIGSQKQRGVVFRDNRPHLLVEKASFESSKSTQGCGTLKISGYVRGQPLNVNGLIHIPGWGTFQMSELRHEVDPYSNVKFELRVGQVEVANPQEQECLQSEAVPDPMDAEQTWPTEEELEAAELKPKKTKKRVAEGTSDYQAAWIVESEDEESANSDDESDDENKPMSDDESMEQDKSMDNSESVVSINEDNYDKELDMDEEKAALVRFKEERMNEMFPDEQDTPVDMSARVRYQRYRGLKDFRNAPWDPMENLPSDYARIYRFNDFRQTKKKVLKLELEGADPGEYVTILLPNVPQSLYDNMNAEPCTLVAYGVLRHEQKMSVINAVIKKHPSCKSTIKSKDTLIFHMGYNRFTCKPIFSEHRTGNKFKYERFLPSDSFVVASYYAPVMFPSASVVIFKQRHDGSHELVASGSMLDVNPNRVVVKRTILSGHPFKIYIKTAVVRYMFFTREDINWFKCIELSTKCGRRGHIREALGSHGHMKCVFDKQLQSQDVVMMSLYKRVFPKWSYDPYVPTPVYLSE